MADPYINNVVTALPFAQDGPGPKGSFDYAKPAHLLTWNGNAQLSNAQSKFGGQSCYFDGVSPSALAVTDTVLNLGATDFTIECYFYSPNVTGAKHLLGKWVNASTGLWRLYLNTNNKLCFDWTINGSYDATRSLSSNGAFTENTWTHACIVRYGNVFTLYMDGVSQATKTSADTIWMNTAAYQIGGLTTGLRLNGYIDDLRVTTLARYTENFTPPTAFIGDYPSRTIKPVYVPLHSFKRQRNTVQWWSGTGTITGLVKIGTTPVIRKVRLSESNSGFMIWEKWANSDGSYTFDTVSKSIDFTVTAIDHTGVYNDVIAARVRAI